MEVIFSIDDGKKLDLKLAEILNKYDVPAIFFIPSNTELNEGQIKQLGESFEIGGHTVSHPQDIKTLNYNELDYEIGCNKEWLERIIGQEIDYFAYPRGRYNDETIQALKNLGYKKARTTLVGNYTEPLNKYRIATSVHVYPNRKEYQGISWLNYAFDILNKASKEENGYFHVWGHSEEIDRFSLWNDLLKLLERVNEYKYERRTKNNRTKNKGYRSNNNTD